MSGLRIMLRIISNLLIITLYASIMLMTLYVSPRGWDIGYKIFGWRLYSLSDIVTFAMLGIILMHIIFKDIEHRKIRDIFRYIWLAVIGWAIITTASRIENPFSRLHVTEYTLIGFLTFRIVYSRLRTRTAYIVTGIAIATFAIVEEVIQYYVPGRTFEMADFYVDLWSAILALFIIDFSIGPEYAESITEKALTRFFSRDRSQFWTSIKFFFYETESQLGKFFKR